MRCDIVQPYAGDTIENRGYHGVALTGSGVAWCVDDERAAPLWHAWDIVAKWGVPIWGSCNGMQLAAHMLGGTCGVSPNGHEDGIAYDLTLTDAGHTHPMMEGRAPVYNAPCVHRDEVQTLPAGAVLLAGHTHSPVQAFAHETDDITFWGTQYHPEFTCAQVAVWLEERGKTQPDLAWEDETPAMALAVRARELHNWLELIET